MKKQQIVAVVFLLAIMIPMAVPLTKAADTLSKPTVTLPSNWKLETDTPYPNDASEYDPAGAGLVVYADQQDSDFVMIYYEKAQRSFTDPQLKAEAEGIFARDHSSVTMDESGVEEHVGFASGYDAAEGAYVLEIVSVKNDVYLNVYAHYGNAIGDQNEVNSLIDSIGIASAGGLLGGPMIFIIIGVIVAVIIVVVVVVVMRRRKKQPQTTTQASMPNDLPPPPPAQTG